jgi:hypothetical protein
MNQGYSGILVIVMHLPDNFVAQGLFFGDRESIPPDSVTLKLFCNSLEKNVQA